MNALLHRENGFDRLSVEDAYVFGFFTPPTLNLKPLPISDPDHPFLLPGDMLSAIGGERRSAGFKQIEFINSWMEYCGSVKFGDFELLCFDYYLRGEYKPLQFHHRDSLHYAAAYYGWLRMSVDEWFVSNTAGAGRIIETKRVVLL
ncbi:hypothetical protein ACH518_09525 [Methylomonas sp. HW2-6]|uniref:hypothetical protein n=1 Tax=Methylomonas sp. HW2-6 TaxID=3376687 RepID=UPI0040437EDB